MYYLYVKETSLTFIQKNKKTDAINKGKRQIAKRKKL